jgi:AraC-like DNA-binding protein
MVPEAAIAAGYASRGSFAKAFAHLHGETPHRWVVAERVAAARVALTATRDPIAFIAHDYGFRDQQHFTNVFHRAVGVTPRAYRYG